MVYGSRIRKANKEYRRQSLGSRGGGKERFWGHIASDALGKTLTTAPPRKPIFLVGPYSLPAPVGAGAGKKEGGTLDGLLVIRVWR